jgi:hypothetical protein
VSPFAAREELRIVIGKQGRGLVAVHAAGDHRLGASAKLAVAAVGAVHGEASLIGVQTLRGRTA